MTRLVFIVAIIVLILVGYFLTKKQAKTQGRIAWIRTGLISLAAVLIFLTVTGRLHFVIGIIGALLPLITRFAPLLRFLPMVKKLFDRSPNGAYSSASGASQVNTPTLQMTLDIQTGKMDGLILAGGFSGRKLSELSRMELRGFYDECLQQDPDAVRLLDAYVQREYAEQWQSTADNQQSQKPPNANGQMSAKEACLILGIKESQAKERAVIVSAHRQLISKLHPDKGGNAYLATKVNQARDILLKGI